MEDTGSAKALRQELAGEFRDQRKASVVDTVERAGGSRHVTGDMVRYVGPHRFYSV